MRRFLLLTGVWLMSFSMSDAIAYTVYCTNCSDRMVQMLERVTNVEQLATMSKSYSEAVEQTAAQLQMVQQNIQQYANMVQNTMQLPKNLIARVASDLSKLASITSSLSTMRNDISGLGRIFDALYQSQSALKDLALTPYSAAQSGSSLYRETWDKWSKRVDDSTRATFQLSGKQLKDLEDSGELENYINQLLQTPEGQQQAIMAGNQLTAMQLQEARQLRELLATHIQAQLASQMKEEKESQLHQEIERRMSEETYNTNSKKDPF